MNEKYFRITAYDKANDYTCILDSNGMFEKLWQFSSYLVNKIEASKMENVIDINIESVDYDTEHIVLEQPKMEKLN